MSLTEKDAILLAIGEHGKRKHELNLKRIADTEKAGGNAAGVREFAAVFDQYRQNYIDQVRTGAYIHLGITEHHIVA